MPKRVCASGTLVYYVRFRAVVCIFIFALRSPSFVPPSSRLVDTAGGNNWTERLFVVKDSFLLYYDKKDAGTSFDMHPKGVVPLDGVEVELVRTGPSVSFQSSMRLSHRSFGVKSVLLCARDDAERDCWVEAIKAASMMYVCGHPCLRPPLCFWREPCTDQSRMKRPRYAIS